MLLQNAKTSSTLARTEVQTMTALTSLLKMLFPTDLPNAVRALTESRKLVERAAIRNSDLAVPEGVQNKIPRSQQIPLPIVAERSLGVNLVKGERGTQPNGWASPEEFLGRASNPVGIVLCRLLVVCKVFFFLSLGSVV